MADLARYNINTRGASLPATYSAARTALEKCVQVDECKSWADKALALKSYAKQAQDDELHKMAARIQGRAIRRVGELLQELEPKRGANQNIRGGTPPKVTRTSAARDAGLSDDQRKTALRVASVPREDFERQIESDDPPTVTELARQGTKAKEDFEKLRVHMQKVVDERPEYPLATVAGGKIKNLAEFCRREDAKKVAHGFQPHECREVREDVETIRLWMGPFLQHLED